MEKKREPEPHIRALQEILRRPKPKPEEEKEKP